MTTPDGPQGPDEPGPAGSGPGRAGDLPVLPYNPQHPTQGWAGSATSRERAEREADDGTASYRQRHVLTLLASLGPHGLTWSELAILTGWHHGQASGVLSVLHQDGRIARLTVRRDRSLVYVDLDAVDGRATSPHSKARDRLTPVERAALERARGSLMVTDPDLGLLLGALDRLGGRCST